MTKTSHPYHENGAALLTALIFLVIITLLAISAMRSSTLELNMAGNEQAMNEGLESAQSAIDSLMTPSSFRVTTGYVGCYNYPAGAYPGDCTLASPGLTLPVAAGTSTATNRVKVELKSEGAFSCRACESSASLFDGAIFHIDSRYDNTANRGGRVEIVEGFLTLIPKN